MLLLGRQVDGALSDLLINIEVRPAEPGPAPDHEPPPGPGATAAGPALVRYGREWFVALALAEPWLAGRDDYPRPPSNREIFERVQYWHGYAWNLQRPQRVDEAIRAISILVFGLGNDPFRAPHDGRLQNVRFAVARRTAELGLVTPADLAEVERGARNRPRPPG